MDTATVLITGGASGIGRAAARLFAARGWRCVLVDRDAQGLAQLLPTLPAPAQGTHQTSVTDLTRAADIEALADQVPALDALINNAGMSDSRNIALDQQSPADLDRLLALNLHAPAALVQALTHRLVPGGRIVNVASGAGFRAIPWRGAYSPGKAGLMAQSQALARARTDWCVSVLSPGFVRTELVDSLIAAGRLDPQAAVTKIPLGRMALPEEMACALFFLASADARPLSGQVLAVDGGSSVYGGSQPLPAATQPPWPFNAPLQLRVEGDAPDLWMPDVPTQPAQPSGPGYRACLDTRARHAAPDQLLHAVHAAAADFAAQQTQATQPTQPASLTLLLPDPCATATDWALAGEAAATRMLVATLACEWGARGLRINALEVPPDMAVSALRPIVHFVAGAQAQYLSGQTLRLG